MCFSQDFQEPINLGKITTYIETKTSLSKEYTKEQIEQSLAKDLSDFLEKEGFLIINSGGIGSFTNVSIGGYSGFCIKVYIDGVLANNPSTGEFDWNQLDINSIESIKINYAPQSSDTEFAGASISISTKKYSMEFGEMSGQTISYANSLFDSTLLKANFCSNIGPLNYKLDISTQQASNNYELPNSKTNKGNENRLGSAGLSFDTFLGDLALSFDSHLSYNQYATNTTSILDGTGVEKSLNNRESLLLNYKNHKLGLIHQGVKSDYNSTHQNVQTLEANYSFKSKKTGYINFSKLRYEFSNSFNAQRFSLSFGTTKNFIFNNGFSIIPSLICLGSKSTDSSILLEPLPKVSFVSPFGLTYSIFRSFSLPTFNQLYWNDNYYIPNPNLVPESGWGHSLSFLRTDFPLYAIIQNSWYANKITWAGKNENGSFAENSKNGIFLSATLGSNYSWKYIGYNFSFTYTKAVINEWDGPQIMWVPKIQGCFNLFSSFSIFDFRLNYTFVGKRAKTNENFSFYEPYNLLSFSCIAKISKQMYLGFNIDNILDDRYYYHDNFSAPSRSISFHVKYKY